MLLRLLSLFLLAHLTAAVSAQAYTTHRYHDGLELDLYAAGEGASSLVIYVHGGGFSGGNRSEGNDYCQFLQANGINCATITYTLSMQGRSQD